MFIPPDILESVAFVSCKTNKGRMVHGGTVFFTNIRDKHGSEEGWNCAITARHVIDSIKKFSIDDMVYFRLNRKGGSTELVRTKLKDWRFHPTDKSVDVAVLPWTPDFKKYDVKVFPLDGFAMGDIDSFKDHGVIAGASQVLAPIDIGSDLFIAGLFAERPGNARNIPIIRMGNIAAMAGEPIPTRFGDVVVHLIESRSIGGLSGSPVFANLGNMRKVGGRIMYSTDGGSLFYLFGLIHGHFDEERATVKTLMKEEINMGVAMVVPVEKILEVIDQPEFITLRQREREKEEMVKRSRTKLDSSLLARSVVEAAIGESLTDAKKRKKVAKKKAAKRAR